MRTAKTMTAKQAGAIHLLLGRRLEVAREQQKRIRDELRDVHQFWISDFGRGLTPAEFEELVEQGRLHVVR